MSQMQQQFGAQESFLDSAKRSSIEYIVTNPMAVLVALVLLVVYAVAITVHVRGLYRLPFGIGEMLVPASTFSAAKSKAAASQDDSDTDSEVDELLDAIKN